MVPISFVSDHVETLYEIDLLYKQMARRPGHAAGILRILEYGPGIHQLPEGYCPGKDYRKSQAIHQHPSEHSLHSLA